MHPHPSRKRTRGSLSIDHVLVSTSPPTHHPYLLAAAASAFPTHSCSAFISSFNTTNRERPRIQEEMAGANDYEELRRRNMEANRRKQDELGLHLLYAKLCALAPEPSPVCQITSPAFDSVRPAVSSDSPLFLYLGRCVRRSSGSGRRVRQPDSPTSQSSATRYYHVEYLQILFVH